MATSPEQVRHGLQLVTSASVAELEAVATSVTSLSARRSLLLRAAPLIVGAYVDGSAALAVDWYEELRDESVPTSRFTPTVVAPVRSDYVDNAVAWATAPEQVVDGTAAETLRLLSPVIQREVAAGFWESISDNAAKDSHAIGWRRIARAGACTFCRMLADKGAIYSESSVRFAAHRACHCVAEPAFLGSVGPQASVMQYMASKKRRSPAEKARLREYLQQHYGA